MCVCVCLISLFPNGKRLWFSKLLTEYKSETVIFWVTLGLYAAAKNFGILDGLSSFSLLTSVWPIFQNWLWYTNLGICQSKKKYACKCINLAV